MGFEAIDWNSPGWAVPLRSAGEDPFAVAGTAEAVYSSARRTADGAQDNPLFKVQW